jgi:hypothetical protein
VLLRVISWIVIRFFNCAKLGCEIINGKQATERKLTITDTIKDDSEIVVTYLTRALEPARPTGSA